MPALNPAKATIGSNLQTAATVALSEPAPEGGMKLTLTSADPSRLLLSRTPDLAGAPVLTINVREKLRESPEFWLHALAGNGEVTYTASAPGYSDGKGVVTLTPSGIVITGPLGKSVPRFTTTPRAWPTKLTLHTARLDSELKVAESQFLRGGMSLEVKLTSSNPSVGTVASPVTIEAASDTATTDFKPAGGGETTVALALPPGFSAVAGMTSVLAAVKTPGIAIADDTLIVGENLQAAATVSLGEPAPAGGVAVTLTSSDPSRLLLSAEAKQVGSKSVTIHIPAGSISVQYYLQGLASRGTPAHTVTASGYQGRTSTIVLAPSGVIIGTKDHGPPDEAALFRPESTDGKGFVLAPRDKPTPLTIYTAHLDPKTYRCADITVQQLRAGMTVDVELKNSHPEVGKIATRVTLTGGNDTTVLPFHPVSAGTTIITLPTPKGFTTPSNATEMKVSIVQ
jgi:hypothetical protein